MSPVFKQKLEANQQAYDHGLILIAIVVFVSVLSLIKRATRIGYEFPIQKYCRTYWRWHLG